MLAKNILTKQRQNLSATVSLGVNKAVDTRIGNTVHKAAYSCVKRNTLVDRIHIDVDRQN